MTGSFPFGLRSAAAAAPLPVGETGVASGKGLLGRPSNETASARQRNGVFVLRRKALGAREGSALSDRPRRRPYRMREGSSPGWAETLRSSGAAPGGA